MSLKTVRYGVLLAVLYLCCSAFTLKSLFNSSNGNVEKSQPSVYVVGFAFSFCDSLVYITEIQEMPDVNLTYNGFLPQREEYSYQLSTYLQERNGNHHYNCVTIFSDRREKLVKKVERMQREYIAKRASEVYTIRQHYFTYKNPATMWDDVEDMDTETTE